MNAPQNQKSHQTSLLFAFSFLTASTYVFTRALAISLFLARLGPDGLPLAFAASAFIVIGVSNLTRIAIRRFRTNRAAILTWILLGSTTVVFGIVLGPFHHSLIALCALYVFAEVRGSLNTIYMVSLSNEAFAKTESNRPYAIVASGAPIAGIIIGFVLGLEASLFLLLPAIIGTAVLDGLSAIVVSFFRSDQNVKVDSDLNDPLAEGQVVVGKKKGLQPEAQSQFRFFLAGLMSLMIAVLTLVGYQWKVAAGNYFGSDETQMVSYFATFYAVSDTLIVLLQWLVVGRIIDRFGIVVGLIGLPISIGLIAIVAISVESPVALLIVFTLGMGLNVFRRSLHDPGLTIAYNVLDPMIRPETIVFVKGIVKPFAEALAACLLLVVAGVIAEIWITWFWLVMTVPWVYFAVQVALLYQTKGIPLSADPKNIQT